MTHRKFNLVSRGGAFGLVFGLAAWLPASAMAQGQALPDVKVNLPAPPNFDVQTAPVQYDSGEFSIFGLRKSMSKYLDKDVQIKAYLLEVYECPEAQRKCNDGGKKSAAKKAGADEDSADGANCRPCDQPHFFLADSPTTKKSRALLVADYPVKDWKTGKPRPFDAKLATVGQQYVVTGTFAINSMTGFAASNGLLIHKKTEDLDHKVLLEGNAVLPPEAQTIELEGKTPQKLAPGR